MIRCIGCQAEFPETAGPHHEYMLSAPGCWAVYGEILAREYSDSRLMRLHRLTVDTYAVQHPGVNVPAARRSVAVHLSRLYLLLERGWPMEQASDAMVAISALKDQRPWLEPPSMAGTLTVLDVAAAPSNEAHEKLVTDWAQSVWNAWKAHHPIVRSWCADLETPVPTRR